MAFKYVPSTQQSLPSLIPDRQYQGNTQDMSGHLGQLAGLIGQFGVKQGEGNFTPSIDTSNFSLMDDYGEVAEEAMNGNSQNKNEPGSDIWGLLASVILSKVGDEPQEPENLQDDYGQDLNQGFQGLKEVF